MSEEAPNTEQVKEDSSESNPTGRPEFEITKEVIDQAELLASQGLTQHQIALALGMGESTLYEKKRNFPEFAQAIKAGKAKGVAMVAEKLMEKAMAMDTTSILFYLKCQGGWRDTPEQTYSDNGTLNIRIHGGPDSDVKVEPKA